MTDLLIRDVSDDVLAVIDAKAAKLGLSRSEYLRRALVREGQTTDEPVTVESLARFGRTFADLADDEAMSDAWS